MFITLKTREVMVGGTMRVKWTRLIFYIFAYLCVYKVGTNLNRNEMYANTYKRLAVPYSIDIFFRISVVSST